MLNSPTRLNENDSHMKTNEDQSIESIPGPISQEEYEASHYHPTKEDQTLYATDWTVKPKLAKPATDKPVAGYISPAAGYISPLLCASDRNQY